LVPAEFLLEEILMSLLEELLNSLFGNLPAELGSPFLFSNPVLVKAYINKN